jgi:hypothetical protein
MVPQDLRGRPDAVVAVMMSGYELGIAPMQALQSINLIQGKPSLSAELMRALILQAGHQIIVEATNEAASAQFRRRDWPAEKWSEIVFTIDDAKRAGLVEWFERWETNQGGKRYKRVWNPHGPDERPAWVDEDRTEHRFGDNYFSRPRSMLTARATSEVARNSFADVLAGLSYTPDEVLEFAPVPSGLSRPGEVSVDRAASEDQPAAPPPVDPAAHEAMQALAEVIRSIADDDERQRLVDHLRDTFGPSGQMSPSQIEAATAIAAGWPSTAPAPESEGRATGAPF